MKTKYTIFFLLFINFTSGQAQELLSSDEKYFYEKLITAFRENSIERAKIDWKEFEKKVLEKALISKDSAIILALDLNNNLHTFYNDNSRYLYCSKHKIKRDTSLSANNCFDINFKNELPGIGYIEVAGLRTNSANPAYSKANAENYINHIVDSIKSIDKNELKGWIIDLRKNGGGNMWPMLIALTPFYPDDTLGYFINDKETISWSKMNHQIFYNDFSYTHKYISSPVHYNLKNKNLKIAVLIGPRTSSAGEAVAISTKSIKEAKLFGLKTSGFSTANRTIKIADGEFLVLTTAVDADLNMVEYWDGINPDFIFNCENAITVMKKWFEE